MEREIGMRAGDRERDGEGERWREVLKGGRALGAGCLSVTPPCPSPPPAGGRGDGAALLRAHSGPHLPAPGRLPGPEQVGWGRHPTPSRTPEPSDIIRYPTEPSDIIRYAIELYDQLIPFL